MARNGSIDFPPQGNDKKKDEAGSPNAIELAFERAARERKELEGKMLFKDKTGKFDPHSVASAVSVEEQQRNKEGRLHAAGLGIIPPNHVEDLDVSIDNARVSQYRPSVRMQKEMDALNRVIEPVAEREKREASRIQELRAQLDKLNRESVVHNFHHDDIEKKVEALEQELRALESGGRPKKGDEKSVVKKAKIATPVHASVPVVVAATVESTSQEPGNTEDLVAHARQQAENRRQVLEEEETGQVPEAEALEKLEEKSASGEAPMQPSSTLFEASDRENWQDFFGGALTDRTPSEWREELRSVAEALEKLETKFGVSPKGESLKVHIENQSGESAMEEGWLGEEPDIEAEEEKIRPAFQAEKFLTERLGEFDKKSNGFGGRVRAFVAARGEEYKRLSLRRKLFYSTGLATGALIAALIGLVNPAADEEAASSVAKVNTEPLKREVAGKISVSPKAPEARKEAAPKIIPTPAQKQVPPVEIKEPKPIQTVDVTQGQEEIATQAPAPVIEKSFMVNRFGVRVPLGEAHIYADESAEHLLAYGGSPEERADMILEYLTKNPDRVVFCADSNGEHRIPWHLVDGKAIPESPVQTGGFFGFFGSFMQAPAPEEFRELVK